MVVCESLLPIQMLQKVSKFYFWYILIKIRRKVIRSVNNVINIYVCGTKVSN